MKPTQSGPEPIQSIESRAEAAAPAAVNPLTAAASLEELRLRIDELDIELVRLLARREDRVREVARVKAGAAALPAVDPGRERDQLARWTRRAREEGLSSALAERVLREVLDHSRRAQEPVLAGRQGLDTRRRVVFQGERHAFGDLAAAKLFATRQSGPVDRVGVPSFRAAVDAVESGDADYALLPIENSTIGGIDDVAELLLESGLTIVDEEVFEAAHVLAAWPAIDASGLRRVRSHPAALAQCRAFLRGLANAEPEPWYDTAGAAASLAAAPLDVRNSTGVLCSKEAAEAYGLDILARRVADERVNATRFVLVARRPEPSPRGAATKTSLAVLLDHRRGELVKLLQKLASASVNLTRIESRPRPRTPWQYLFLVDFESNSDDAAVAVDEARSYCNWLRVLGTYPSRTGGSDHLDGAIVPKEPEAPVKTLTSAAPRIVVDVGAARIGSDRFVLIAGPCAVESRDQIHEAAAMVRARGATVLRGGAFKPRTNPRSFQGLGIEGLKLLAAAGRSVNLPVVTEIVRIEDLDAVAADADMLQIGARNMQNFALLRAVGRSGLPVLLKRGLSATIAELLSAADYVLAEGNRQVVLCERGIRTFESATRNTLDLSAVAVLKERSPLPVIVDPSHAAGRRALVVPLALAAAAVGADGVIVEAHPNPAEALCDKEQALTADDLDALVKGLSPILASQGRSL